MTPVAHALFKLSLLAGVGPARLRRAIGLALARQADLAELVEHRALHDVLTPHQLAELSCVGARADAIVEKLLAIDVDLISSADAEYPAQMLRTWGEDRAPPLLMARGNVALLARPTVGFSGSRRTSERGLRVARDCAEQLVAADVVVASGYAAGVDTCAHAAALAAGGATIIVLAEGIEHFLIKPEMENGWSWERACVVSEFSPSAPWSAGNALRRNRTIVGVSQAVIVIEALETGGTIATGRDALSGRVPLFAVEYGHSSGSAIGNRRLIAEGAQPLLRNRQTQRANLDGVFDAVLRPASSRQAPVASRQMLLPT